MCRAIKLVIASLVVAMMALTACASRGALGGRGSTPRVLSADVVRVIDGDTFVIALDGKKQRVRLRSINCPEYNEPGGSAATDAARAALTGRRVELTIWAHDVYGRLLADVRLGGDPLAGWLVPAHCAGR